MASIDYCEIFNGFLGNVTDNDFVNLSLDDSNELMTELLRKSLGNKYVSHIFSSFSMDDDVQVLTYTMATADTIEEQDELFVIEVLAHQMTYEWIKPQLNSVNLTKQFFGTKEQSWFSQSAHLQQMRGLAEDSLIEVRRLIRDRGYIVNEYLQNGGKL